MEKYLTNYTYQIFVIEQTDNKPFNRGKLLNVGYKIACNHKCDYFVFHDVDMLPINVDYSYTDKPLHLATHLQENDYEISFFDYFGGVTLFNKEDFEKINGYSNEYLGWGFEDDDLLIRCLESDLELDVEHSDSEDIETFETFKFDGDSSFIELTKIKKSTALSDDFTISVMVIRMKIS
jgi:predicted glycosyltransferase involved in capsule biosynthesis